MTRLYWLAGMLALPLIAGSLYAQEARRYRAYIGTYTGPKSKGIYQIEFDAQTGKLGQPQLAAENEKPSFLAIHPTGRYLYAVNEVAMYQGEKSGYVSAFAVQSGDGSLQFLNQQSSRGAVPCHIVLDAQGKHALIANYTGGSVGVLPIGDDGKLQPMSSFVQHEGSSVDPRRQKEPHAHSINLDKANRFAFAADLGLDQVLVYRYENGQLSPNNPPHAKVPPGSGPRHFSFHPNGKFAYVINEIANTITAFAYDADRGRLKELQTITTLPEGYDGRSYTAEVVVHPSGKFVYGSNRGHNSIAAFRVDESTGKLTLVGFQGEGVNNPRNFIVEPGGRFALVGSQGTDRLLVFRINAQTGALEPTEHQAEIGAPVCIRLWPL